ncbi:MAG: amino acid ABC transporter permease [Actinomycetes bacterium]
MDVLIDNFGEILEGFRTTLALFAASAVIALLLGTVLGAMRVSPVPVLRAAGTVYVNVARNTPLVVVFLLVVFCLPELGVQLSFFVRASIALSLYTASFVCEAVRSGVNAVSTGQSEAARAVGMTFGQSLGQIVLPQAFRTVIPPLVSILIALAKNTSIASAFGVIEATALMKGFIRDNPGDIYAIFFGFAAGYVLITLSLAGIARLIESKVAIVR